MAGDAERRFEKIMSRLSPSPSPNRNKSRHGINQLGDGIFGGRMRSESGLRVSATNSRGLVPPCRPWDRGDLMRRMATFKAMTWFAKPQAINPVNCARRGWINVEMDVIACEACGARLLFATPSAWTLQQVEKAAAVFSLKLDNGHRLLCPWIDNTCDEALALFPPTPPPVLVDGYRERAAALLRLTALPVVSLSAIDCMMRGPQLELFLSQPSHLLVTWKNGMKLADDPRSKDIPGASKDATAEKYYQAQKIISLCGWEPRLLPYVVDKNDPSKSSAEILVEQESTKTYTANGSSDDSVGGNNNLPSLGEYQYDPAASVVLDCRFCGACVGLWAFTTMQRPLESFTLLGDSSGQNEPDSRCMDLVNGIETSTDESLSKGYQCFTKEDHISATTKGRPLGLNLTIAGGPPPTKQNFRPVVSFPIISRHLSSEMANNFGFGSHVSSEVTFGNHVNSQPNPHDDIQCEQQTDDTGGFSVSPEGSGSCKRKRSEIELNVSESNDVNDVSRLEGEVHGVENGFKILEKTVSSSKGWSNGAQGTHTLLNENRVNDLKRREQSSENVEENVLHSEQTTNNSVEVGESVCATSVTIVTTPASVAQANNSFAVKDHADNTNEDTCSTIDLLNSDGTCEYNQDDPSNIASSSGKHQVDGSNTFQNINDVKNNDQKDVVANMVLATTGRKDDANHASVDTLGDTLQPPIHHNFNEFDPIRQHRPFCPWITPVDGKSLPGWKLTLSALVQQEKDLSPGSLQLDSSPPLLDEEDDPITSIRKLFRSPSSKRPPSKRWKDSH